MWTNAAVSGFLGQIEAVHQPRLRQTGSDNIRRGNLEDIVATQISVRVDLMLPWLKETTGKMKRPLQWKSKNNKIYKGY